VLWPNTAHSSEHASLTSQSRSSVQVLDRVAKRERGNRRETPGTKKSSELFDKIGCATCHVRPLTTAPVGAKINGGTFTILDALAGKTFHLFGDFVVLDGEGRRWDRHGDRGALRAQLASDTVEQPFNQEFRERTKQGG